MTSRNISGSGAVVTGEEAEGIEPASDAIRIGLERLVSDYAGVLESRSFALLMNRASVCRDIHLACDVLAGRFPGQLKLLFTPQHGLWGEQQANMIETDHSFHRDLQIPVFSLYSRTRRPLPEMLAGVDCLVVDLQDVGTRVYTFIWTLMYCLDVCAEREITVVVADRPNPIGGMISEGPKLDLNCRSFVGEAEIPMRHGLTIAEIARFLNSRIARPANLVVIPMSGWRRGAWFEESGRVWIPPSPNMPAVQTAVVYPGQVLLEGTNLSEGRGTTVPFEIVGAPFIDEHQLCHHLQSRAIPGVCFLPVRFTPTFDKWCGQSCGGVSLHVVNRDEFRPYRTTIEILMLCRQLAPEQFQLTMPPYEYEKRLRPIDIISGSSRLREVLEGGGPADAAIGPDSDEWNRERSPFLMYK